MLQKYTGIEARRLWYKWEWCLTKSAIEEPTFYLCTEADEVIEHLKIEIECLKSDIDAYERRKHELAARIAELEELNRNQATDIEGLKTLIGEMNEPYFGYCEVDGCEREASNGGCGWPDTGYWNLCSEHYSQFRGKKDFPKMKAAAVKREQNRTTKPEEGKE